MWGLGVPGNCHSLSPEDDWDRAKFFELGAQNKGYRVGAFQAFEKALTWLYPPHELWNHGPPSNPPHQAILQNIPNHHSHASPPFHPVRLTGTTVRFPSWSDLAWRDLATSRMKRFGIVNARHIPRSAMDFVKRTPLAENTFFLHRDVAWSMFLLDPRPPPMSSLPQWVQPAPSGQTAPFMLLSPLCSLLPRLTSERLPHSASESPHTRPTTSTAL